MRIAIVTLSSKPIGGVETVTHMLKKVFEQQNHTVQILSTDSLIPQKKTVAQKLFGLPYLTATHFKSDLHQYDLVIGNGEFSWGIKHPRAIALFHGSYYGMSKYLKPYLGKKTRLLLKRDAWIQKICASNKTVVTVSPFTRNLLEEQGIRVHYVIPNGVNTDVFKPSKSPHNNRCLFVANQFGPLNYFSKGFDILETLADIGYPIDCVSNAHPGSKLGWIQGVQHPGIHRIYPSYKTLIFPSRYEANALVPLEAMACGVPVVMGPVGYASEIQKTLPECVVDDWRVESFHRRLQEIEKDREGLSFRCRQFAEQHSEEVFGKNWLRFIDQIAK